MRDDIIKIQSEIDKLQRELLKCTEKIKLNIFICTLFLEGKTKE
jgi:hypothetical protein